MERDNTLAFNHTCALQSDQKAFDNVHLDIVIGESCDRVRQDIRRSSLVLDVMLFGEIDDEPLQP